MKKFYCRFLEVTARFTGRPIEKRLKDGTLGLGEYIYLIAKGLKMIFFLIVVCVVIGMIELCSYIYGCLKEKVVNSLNRVRVSVPK